MTKRNSFKTALGFLALLAGVPAAGAGDEAAVRLAGAAPEFACYNCHAWRESVTDPRSLGKPHDALTLTHGAARFWCLECHNPLDMDTLRDGDGAKLAFDQSHRNCAKCHADRVRDWQHGAHGKRTGGWQGPRTLVRCSACHDPHRPAWKPAAASPPPPGRFSAATAGRQP